MTLRFNIRFAKQADLESMVEIYNQAICSGNATGDMDEFTTEDRRLWFSKHHPDQYPLYVAELNQQVLGYCSISPYRPGRRAMANVAEISYYLDYSHHGKGIGSTLIKHAIADCKRIHKKSLLAILLDINLQSIGILEKFGFERWGHFPNIINLNHQKCGHLIYGINL